MSITKDEILNNAWLGIKVKEDTLFNPLADIPEELQDQPYNYILWLLQQPEYFSFFCDEILNVKLLPIQAMMLNELWNHKFPMLIASRGFGKSFILAVYALLRMVLMPGRKIVICGAGFRQSKVIFGYMETIWRNSPILRSMFPNNNLNGPKHEPDMYKFILDESICLAIPIGDGTTIRGLRANDIIADEFASIPREIFETVIKGFSAVKAAPQEAVKLEAAKRYAKMNNIKLDIEEEAFGSSKENQMIIAGTAYYDFNHFAEYYKKWKKIITSKGDPSKLEGVFGEDDVPESFNHKDYCIIRIPYELIPKGFMDDAMVNSSKASSHIGIYQMEYGACFTKDSYGFFKRSLIERCVVGPHNKIEHPSGVVNFTASLAGRPDKKYIFGIDPASEVDKFSITIIEMHSDHRRIVYVWSTNKKEFNEKLKLGLVQETDYYGYCARKIRDLMKKFPCERIMLDSQGGGIAVNEALHDRDKLKEGEHPLWPVIVPGEYKDSDGEEGLHIIELVNFADPKWVVEANHGMKKDMEDKVLIFPYFDSISLGLAAIQDQQGNLLYDTLEDCLYEIEELKNELSTIIHTQTQYGRDKWDTPEVKLAGNKKGRLRKDRYSSLLMANMGARCLARNPVRTMNATEGGFAAYMNTQQQGSMYNGPSWMSKAFKDLY